MNRIPATAVLALTLSTLAGVPAMAAEWPLVSTQEEARDDAAPHVSQANAAAVSGAPVIDVKQPNLSYALHNPITFDVHFIAAPGSRIDLSTFQVKYGWLGINITHRLLEHATRTASGLFAADVDVPAGNHRISLSIADSIGRVGTRVINLLVSQ